MHIELSPKYEESLTKLINLLDIEASITDSFSASGETIILAADREDLQRIIDLEEANIESNEDSSAFPEDFDEIRAILNEQLNEDI